MTQKLLAEEIASYKKRFDEFRRTYAGRYLVVHRSKLVGDYENELEAAYEGYRHILRRGARA